MNTIDQRILIPTPPNVVWDYLGDLTKNPEWQADCKTVSFLTSKRSGPGTRMRFGSDKGQERVIEITAWYDGLGYQYTYVDGMPFRESTGRIRLQEIPEGTVVQWTFTYDVGGLLGGVRSSLGLGRQLETAMETSLKSLWRQVNQTGSAQKIREAKSLMRDAPDYEARAQYKPRHPAVVDVKGGDEQPGDTGQPGMRTRPSASVPLDQQSPRTMPPVRPAQSFADEFHVPSSPARAPIIDEPPIADEDTRPRPPVTAPVETLIETTEEPEFLDEIVRFAPPPDYTTDTQPIKPITDLPPLADEPPAAIATMAETGADAEIHAPETDLEPDFLASFLPVVDQPEDLTADLPVVTDVAESRFAEPERPSEMTVAAPPTELPTMPASPPIEAQRVTTTTEEQPTIPMSTSEPSVDATQGPHIPSREELSKLDTASMSIWEIFGVPRPSEIQAADMVKEEVETAANEPLTSLVAAEEPVIEAVSAPALPVERPNGVRRGGLRMRMRREKAKLRFPV